jgi:hypothetical protein
VAQGRRRRQRRADRRCRRSESGSGQRDVDREAEGRQLQRRQGCSDDVQELGPGPDLHCWRQRRVKPGCQTVYFQIIIWVNFGECCNGSFRQFLRPFGIFYGILVLLWPTGIFYVHLVYFDMLYQEKSGNPGVKGYLHYNWLGVSHVARADAWH